MYVCICMSRYCCIVYSDTAIRGGENSESISEYLGVRPGLVPLLRQLGVGQLVTYAWFDEGPASPEARFELDHKQQKLPNKE